MSEVPEQDRQDQGVAARKLVLREEDREELTARRDADRAKRLAECDTLQGLPLNICHICGLSKGWHIRKITEQISGTDGPCPDEDPVRYYAKPETCPETVEALRDQLLEWSWENERRAASELQTALCVALSAARQAIPSHPEQGDKR
jgi:hypothetical protein